jgi:predicted enzyme related to lactoylglutathione lyase
MAEHGSFYWNELTTSDVKTAKKFYKATLGWTFDKMKMGNGGTYTVIKSGDKMVGGMFDTTGTEMVSLPEHWLSYIAVDDVDKRVVKAKKAGAKVMRPPFDVPGVGRIAIIKQPGGGMVGWMTPSPM